MTPSFLPTPRCCWVLTVTFYALFLFGFIFSYFFIFVILVVQVLVGINCKGMGFDDLLIKLQSGVEQGGDKLQKQAIANIARYVCVCVCPERTILTKGENKMSETAEREVGVKIDRAGWLATWQYTKRIIVQYMNT